MIQGYFSAKGVGKISVIDGKMNAQKYKQILQENLMSFLESWAIFWLHFPGGKWFQAYS